MFICFLGLLLAYELLLFKVEFSRFYLHFITAVLSELFARGWHFLLKLQYFVRVFSLKLVLKLLLQLELQNLLS